MTVPTPTAIERLDPFQLLIAWSDGTRRTYQAAELRANCPCASCREKQSAPPTTELFPIIQPEEAAPIQVQGMKPVGNYAYGISFSDGHDTGIFTFERLVKLGQPA